MKVQQIQQQNTTYAKPQFKGAADMVFRFLATNQGVGANATDVCFMVAPRSISDAQRGPAAFAETLRREASGTANHTLIGAYGWLAGALIAAMMGMNKKSRNYFTGPESLNILAENKANQIKNNKEQYDYLKDVFSNIKAYNPTAKGADKEGYIKLSSKTIEDVSKIMDEVISGKNKMDYKTWAGMGSYKTENSIHVVMNKIIADTGAESKYVLESSGEGAEKIKSVSSLKTMLEDVFKISDSFNDEKVVKAFKEQVESGKGIKDNAYIKKLSKFLKSRSIAGVAVATAIGMSIQPLNIYLTKLKTGSDGFVGVEGRSKDDSAGFKMLKGTAAAAFGGLTLASLRTGFKGFLGKMAFTGFWPTISQLKGIYGLTIISRLVATRDKDELRESLTKDTLGFLSWLVLGDIVNKITANAIDDKKHSVLNSTEGEVEGLWNKTKKIFKSSLKTRDEILVKTLSENGIETVKNEGGKIKAKKFNEMLKDLDKLSPEVKKVTKRQLKTLNKAQAAGYLFSGLVLGFGIPNLNIYITNKLDKKRKEKQAAAGATT